MEDPFVYGHFWWMLLEAGRFEEADDINGRQERLLTTPAALELARAEAVPLGQLARGDYAKADEGFTRHFASSPPREAHHLWIRARAKTGHGQHDQAVAILRDGLKQLPRNCRLWQVLGSAQAARGRPEDIAAARLLIAQGRPAEAKVRLDALIKIAPNSDGAVIDKEILAGVAAKS